jgi:hypothetical protein
VSDWQKILLDDPAFQGEVVAEAKRIAAANKRPDWQPNPDKDDIPNPQRLALECLADELFYGGAAGGGKTDLLVGCAFIQHQRAAIFRRVYPNLEEIIDRSIEIVGDSKRYNRVARVWRLPYCRLEFESCQHEDNKKQQQGRPRDFYGFDEITEFTRTQYLFIAGWNRTTDPDQRCRVIVTGNPPTDEAGSWVIDEWEPWLNPDYHDPAEPGELRWYYHDGDNIVWLRNGDPVEVDGETIYPRNRTFIPARLDDNPHLASDNRYRSVLQSMPEPLRSQLLKGDFQVGLGPDPWQVIPTAWVRIAQRRWLETEKPEEATLSGVGVDVARGGRDKTAISKRYITWYDRVEAYPGSKTTDGPIVAELTRQAIGGDETPGYINVDVIGVGSSAYDSLKAMYEDKTFAINAAGGSSYTDRSGKLKMKNMRAEYYWRMREALDPQFGDNLALPPGNEIVADLCAARYKITAGGNIQVEEKEAIKQRIGRSPDIGEAILLANLVSEPAKMTHHAHNPFFD